MIYFVFSVLARFYRNRSKIGPLAEDQDPKTIFHRQLNIRKNIFVAVFVNVQLLYTKL
jgi:hypothetical protein